MLCSKQTAFNFFFFKNEIKQNRIQRTFIFQHTINTSAEYVFNICKFLYFMLIGWFRGITILNYSKKNRRGKIWKRWGALLNIKIDEVYIETARGGARIRWKGIVLINVKLCARLLKMTLNFHSKQTQNGGKNIKELIIEFYRTRALNQQWHEWRKQRQDSRSWN